MIDIQLRQVNILARQILLADDSSKRAATCLAHLVKPGKSLVAEEAFAVLLGALDQSKPPETRKNAAWALANLAGYVSPQDLGNEIVPRLIQVLDETSPDGKNLDVLRQTYQSLIYIGTPDAIIATENWRMLMKSLQGQP